MSISNPSLPVALPSRLRVLAIVIHSGIAVPDNKVTEGEPTVYGYRYASPINAEVVVQPCEPMLDGNGNAMINEFGLPLYVDKGGAKSFKITEMSKLMPFLSTWENMVAAAEVEIAERAANGTL